MILRPRSYFGWGATGAAYARPRSGLVVHYNGGPTNLDSLADCVAYWKKVRRDHRRGNGWDDLGYSFGVAVDGSVFEGRGLNRYQAAQGTTSGNSNYYSVSLMIGGNERPTDAQIQGVRDLRAYLMKRGNSGRVLEHNDFVSTSCPGPVLGPMVRNGTFGGAGNGNVSGGGGGAREYVAEDGDGLLEPYEYSGEIAELQRALGIEDDTFYGPDTIAAVRAYQKKHDLQVDGIAGPETLGHLDLDTPEDGAGGASFPAWPGVYLDQPPVKKTKACRRWQQRMRNRGWSITVDGWYGPASERVCRQFQDEKGLGVDGIVGPKTWRASWTAPVT